MPEQQNIEYKQSWHDEYLKWVCGFANAHGGTIYIGKDDDGKIVGVADYKKLMDDLPNKIRDVLGIMAEVICTKTAVCISSKSSRRRIRFRFRCAATITIAAARPSRN